MTSSRAKIKDIKLHHSKHGVKGGWFTKFDGEYKGVHLHLAMCIYIILWVKCTVGPLTFAGVLSRSINFQTVFLGPLTFCDVSSRSINFQTRFLGPLTFDGVSSRYINFQIVFSGSLTLGGVSSTSIPWCDLARCPLLAAPCPQAPPRSLHLPAVRLRRFHVRPSLSIHTF
jgi:hypothetical protein